VTRADKKKIKKKIHCARKAASKKIMRAKVARWKRWRVGRERYWRLTPYLGPHGSRWAIPCAIVACESRGNFRAYNGVLGAGGAYQVIPGTWAAYGGRRFAPVAQAASRYGQHVIASRIWAGGRGRGQWAC